MNKKIVCYFQIFLMISMAFAVSYSIDSSVNNKNPLDYLFSSVLNLISKPIFAFADAATSLPSVCCEKLKTGTNFCLNVDSSQCDESINNATGQNYRVSPTSCESTSYCKLGTCYDSKEGVCIENTPQIVCENKSGTWDSRAASEIDQCQLGCCVIADQAAFVPLVRCKRLSTFFGVAFDYRKDITSEAQCIATAQSQDMGACVYAKDFAKTCKFTTRKDCNAQEAVITVNATSNLNNETIPTIEKKFYKDYLCSAEELGTDCARQMTTGCESGKVYWFDSCGNKENVYSSNKDKSWNRGRVATPEQVCGKNDGTNKDCGNCEYLLGSRCAPYDKGILGIGKPASGDYICKKTDCTDKDGKTYKNGESWCVYDASVGNGTDPVGSRHFRYVCSDGSINVEPCADFRQQVCIQGQVKTEDGAFKAAACRVNRWQDCAAILNENDCTNLDKRDCAWLPAITGFNLGGSTSSSVGGSSFSNPTTSSGAAFSNPTATGGVTATGSTTGKVIAPLTGNALFGGSDTATQTDNTSTNRPNGICVPDIPPGLKFWEDGDARGICGAATSNCTVTYEVGKFSGKKCVKNCECLEDPWALSMNKVCMSLGDCGGQVNYIGKYNEDGYEWKLDGKTKKFSPSEVNNIIKEGKEGGVKSDGLSYGAVLGITAGIGLIGLIKGGAAATSAESLLPNLVKMIPGGIGEKLATNWLSSAAFNAALIGGVVYLGASMFGAKNPGVWASAATIGLLAGGVAGHFAATSNMFGVTTLSGDALKNAIANPGKLIEKPGISYDETSLADFKSVFGENAEPATKIFEAPKGWTGTLTPDGTGILTSAENPALTANIEAGQLTSITQPAMAQYAGLINLGVTIGVAILVYYYLNRETETEIVTYTCMPWQAPRGGSDCEKCNDDLKPCSEYRCKSLGGTCNLVNKGTTEERCVNTNPKDVEPPIITPAYENLTSGYKYSNVKTNPPSAGFQIVGNGTNPCIKAFTPLKFGVSLNEPAQCKIDFNHTAKMDDMQYWFGGKNLFAYNQTEQLVLPGTKALENVSGLILQNGKDLILYMRCRDYNGNENPAEYAIKFCTDSSPDTTAPEIKATSINNNGCIPQNNDNATVDFYVSEPADCRWSKKDEDYNNMNNTMSCSSNIYNINALQLYPCTTKLTGIAREDTNFYIRCKDQPGKPDNDRNKNAQSYQFTLRSSDALKIKTISPNQTTIFGAVRPTEVELSAETLYGCDEGKAICYYSKTNVDKDFISFYDTNTASGINKQTLQLDAGNQQYFVKCIDSGGNVARETSIFNVEIDPNAPVVARVYQENEMLKVVTVRDSECVYSLNNCDYTFKEGQSMPYANSTVHVTEWQTDKTYYIKCRDFIRSEPADCSIIVRPLEKFM